MTATVSGDPRDLVELIARLEDLPALTGAVEDWLRRHLRVETVRVVMLSEDGRDRVEVGPDGAQSVVAVKDRAGDVVAVIEVLPGRERRPDLDTLLAGAGEIVGPILVAARRCRSATARLEAAERCAERAILSQEAERARLAREIHDGVSQRLAGLGFHLSAAASLCSSTADLRTRAAVGEALATARRLVCLAGSETRAAINDLRPAVLDDLGLEAALASLGREAGQGLHGPRVGVSVTAGRGPDLPDHVQTALFRIAQECLGNAVRHADAATVTVRLDRGATLVHLTVADDGKGFLLDGDQVVAGRADSFGLRGIRERAEMLGGRVNLDSRPGAGTTIRVSIPITAGG